MKTLPNNLEFSHRTTEFDQNSVPAGILGRHTTAEGVWGKITVTEGSLTYRILEPGTEEQTLDETHYGVVTPQTAHQVVVTGPVKFHVQFFKKAA